MAARQGQNCTTEEIAAYYQISAAHLGRVIRRLQKMGYVKAIRGRKGGVRLDKEPEQLILGDLVDLLEQGATPLDPQEGETPTRVDEQSRLKAILRRAHGLFMTYLKDVTLAAVAAGGLPEPEPGPSPVQKRAPQVPNPAHATHRPVSSLSPTAQKPRDQLSPPRPSPEAPRVRPSHPRSLGITGASGSRPARLSDQSDKDWVPLGRPQP
jgi:Rrf2 family nitric oxide-sensitive transcriptional repressor